MFYGSGAGKLPTASAVVADVVDAAKHLNRTIMTFWSSKKLELSSMESAQRRFFVRIPKTSLEKAKTAFGSFEEIHVDGLDSEVGFITDVLTEKEFEKKAETLSVISRIRREE